MFSLTFDVLFKKSRVDPNSIGLPDRPADDDDDNDDNDGDDNESIEPGDAEEERHFKRKIRSKVKAFSEHKISDRGLLRLRNSILEAMCESIHLEAKGSKEELAELLLHWVSVNP